MGLVISVDALAKEYFNWLCDLVASLFVTDTHVTTFNHLPGDVCHLIIEHLTPTKPLYTCFRQRDIVVLSSTSRAWRTICLPYIFKDIRLRFVHKAHVTQDDSAGPRPLCNRMQWRRVYRARERPVTGVPTLQAFIGLIESSPHITPLIRLLALELEAAHCGGQCCTDDNTADRHALDPDLLLSVLHRLPNLQALQLIDVHLSSKDFTPRQAVIEHLQISYSRVASGTWASSTRDALSALRLFQDVGTLHLSTFPTLSNGTDIILSATANVRVVALRNPWPMQGTLAALARASQLHLTSLDVGDPWNKSSVQEVGPAHALTEDDMIDARVLASLRTLLSMPGCRLKHLGLGAMTLGHPTFYAGSSAERVIPDIVFSRYPALESFAINVAISSCRSGRTQAMLQQTTHVLESMSHSIEDLPSLRTVTLNFELATLGSIHGHSGHAYLIYDLEAYKSLWSRMDDALAGISAVLDVFFEAVESEPCGLDVGDMKDVYFPTVLPVSWAKMKPVSGASSWAMQRRLSMA